MFKKESSVAYYLPIVTHATVDSFNAYEVAEMFAIMHQAVGAVGPAGEAVTGLPMYGGIEPVQASIGGVSVPMTVAIGVGP